MDWGILRNDTMPHNPSRGVSQDCHPSRMPASLPATSAEDWRWGLLRWGLLRWGLAGLHADGPLR